MSVAEFADPCAPCGLCCRSYLVPLFGQDLYRLVTRRSIDPRSFVFFCEQTEPDRMGFRLTPGGTTYGLALTKKHKLEVSQPCTFLVEGESTSRCGVYEDRPIACIAYPMERMGSRIAPASNALCPSGSWATDEADRPSWGEALQRVSRYRDTYAEVVNRWNAWVEVTPGERPSHHVVAYVLQVYDKLADLDRELGPEAMGTIERTWATFPAESPRVATKDQEPQWLTYFRRARTIIDGFFPDLPPLPFARIVVMPAGRGDAETQSQDSR